MEYQILLFYKYVHITDPIVVRDWLKCVCEKYELNGRLIVATEGLNITIEGTTEKTEQFITEIETDERFHHIHYKKSAGTGTAFPKLSVKVRSEIVTGSLGSCDIDPTELTGIHLSPEELHDWIHSKKEFYIIDMRNVYEHAVGKFAGSICPAIENFRDIPNIIDDIKHLKNKTVLTVCTGGVRCEKASGYLITQGFTDVYQLKGGIVSYMEMYPNEDFEGKLYVFDGRTTLGFYTDDPKHKIIGRCEVCDGASEHFVNCDNMWCGRHFILCEQCERTMKSDGRFVCKNDCTVRRPHKAFHLIQHE